MSMSSMPMAKSKSDMIIGPKFCCCCLRCTPACCCCCCCCCGGGITACGANGVIEAVMAVRSAGTGRPSTGVVGGCAATGPEGTCATTAGGADSTRTSGCDAAVTCSFCSPVVGGSGNNSMLGWLQ